MQKMWGVKKVFSFMFFALTISVLLTACGGGGGGGSSDSGNNNPPPPNNNATITGTVAGTTIKAFDLSGNEVASNTATGNPKTFSLNVPAGGSYKFYLIENEGTSNERVYALYQGTTNVFNIASAVTIDIGFVGTSTGKAVPENDPLASGASSGGEDTTIPSSLAGSAFSLADLQGTWNFHGLISGDSPAETPGWYWVSITIDSTGAVTSASTITDSLGNSYYTPSGSGGAFNISTSGIVTNSGVASYRGVMNKNKDMIVATATMAPGASTDVSGYNLQIALKSGGTFASSDLVGTWNFHSITTGDAPAWLGWSYGQANIDGSGNVTFNSYLDSDGNTTTPGGALAISSDGTITNASNPLDDLHGKMNQGKDFIVLTLTWGDGITYELGILTKAGGTFAQSDLTGTWNFHLLTSGDNPDWLGWGYGSVSIDSIGNLTMLSITRSDGDSTLPPPGSPGTINGGGVVTGIDSTFHGVMSQDKSMIIGTIDDGGGGYQLSIWMK